MSATVYFADTGGAQTAVINQTFTVNGALTTPSAATLVVTDPLSTATTYTFSGATGSVFTLNSVGNVTARIPVTSEGLWSYTWITSSPTGFDQAVIAGTFTGFGETLNRYYTSAAELKSRLGITDTLNDYEITRAIQAAAADVEQFTGRFFYQTAAGTVQTYRNDNIYDMDIDDVVSISSFMTSTNGNGVYDVTWSSTQYQLGVSRHKYNVSSKGEPWPYTYLQALGNPGGLYLPYVWAWSAQNRVQITGVFGWPKIPMNVREASLLLAVDHFKRKDSPFGIAGFSEYGPVKIAPNSMVAALLHRYVKPGVKVGF